MAPNPSDRNPPPNTRQLPEVRENRKLQSLMQRLNTKLSQDELVTQVIDNLRQSLQIDRVVLYYFYRQWKGQVTFESIDQPSLSIIGMTGADECFNQDHAQMYLEGRTRAIPNVATEAIHDCHRAFLDSIQVKANLVVPVLPHPEQLWGLLSAHHCQTPRPWSDTDLAVMQAGAAKLATSPTIRTNP